MSAPSPSSPPVAPSPLARVLVGAVRFYQRFISPALPPTCRFYPSCSAYAAEAVQVHGAGRGTWLAIRRLLRCHPWHPGGVDPVPPRGSAPNTDPHDDSAEKREEQAPC